MNEESTDQGDSHGTTETTNLSSKTNESELKYENEQETNSKSTKVSGSTQRIASNKRSFPKLVPPKRQLYREVSAPHKWAYQEDRHQGRRVGLESMTAILSLRSSGPDKHVTTVERQNLNQYRPAPTKPVWNNVNPACAVPMRARPWRPMTWLPYPPPRTEAWREAEEREKERRDCQMAIDLGYETLVGNVLHIDIPGARDLNRSFQNFLSRDPVEWGFPYNKGTVDPPRCCLPRPYLAHQLKERLWKYPRTRIFQTKDE